jgi:hypothetical protein
MTHAHQFIVPPPVALRGQYKRAAAGAQAGIRAGLVARWSPVLSCPA